MTNIFFFFFFSSRRRHTRFSRDWSSDVCSSDLAGSDPDAAALLAELTRQRQQGHAQIARSLARAGALRPKLRERDADDIIDALTSPEVYRTLVGDRGWPPQRYEHWLKDILIDQLLAPPATGGGRTDS